MATSERIQPSYILPNVSEVDVHVLGYSPTLKCCLFSLSYDALGFLNVDDRVTVKKLVTGRLPRSLAISSDGSLLAVDTRYEFFNLSNTIPTQMRVFRLVKDSSCPMESDFQSSFYIKPDFADNIITNLKFFPDASRLVATLAGNRSNEPWCKIFTLPEGLWNLEESPHCHDRENQTAKRNNKTLVCKGIDVCEQGFPVPDDRKERIANAKTEEYFELYNQMYYASNIDSGFFCLAISPDTTRLLAGDSDGGVYIMNPSSQKVIQWVRAYEYYKTVSGCHYNPVFGHHEFATCDESGFLDIWRVEELDNGTEEAGRVSRLKFEAGTSCCSYSPDGKLIALTSAAVFKTYIICSHSGETLYSLVYKEESIDESYFCNSSLFFGHLCQVATVHFDNFLGFWKLPLVYGLSTLCFLVIRTTVNFGDIDSLPLSTSLKLRLKYLYV